MSTNRTISDGYRTLPRLDKSERKKKLYEECNTRFISQVKNEGIYCILTTLSKPPTSTRSENTIFDDSYKRVDPEDVAESTVAASERQIAGETISDETTDEDDSDSSSSSSSSSDSSSSSSSDSSDDSDEDGGERERKKQARAKKAAKRKRKTKRKQRQKVVETRPFYIISKSGAILGRAPTSQASFIYGKGTVVNSSLMQVSDPYCSESHVQIELNPKERKFYILDLGNTNATFLRHNAVLPAPLPKMSVLDEPVEQLPESFNAGWFTYDSVHTFVTLKPGLTCLVGNVELEISAPVEQQDEPAILIRYCIETPQELLVTKRGISIGASPTCDITIEGADLQPVHASVLWSDVRNQFFIQELQPLSMFGLDSLDPTPEQGSCAPAEQTMESETIVPSFDGTLVRLSKPRERSRPVQLRSGDVLRIGRTRFLVQICRLPLSTSEFCRNIHDPDKYRHSISALQGDSDKLALNVDKPPQLLALFSPLLDGAKTPQASPAGKPIEGKRKRVMSRRKSTELLNMFSPVLANSPLAVQNENEDSPSHGSDQANPVSPLTIDDHPVVGDDTEHKNPPESPAVALKRKQMGPVPRLDPSEIGQRRLDSLTSLTSAANSTVMCIMDHGFCVDGNFDSDMKEMEDRVSVISPFGGAENGFYAVFDGHGGPGSRVVADFVSVAFHWNLLQELLCVPTFYQPSLKEKLALLQFTADRSKQLTEEFFAEFEEGDLVPAPTQPIFRKSSSCPSQLSVDDISVTPSSSPSTRSAVRNTLRPFYTRLIASASNTPAGTPMARCRKSRRASMMELASGSEEKVADGVMFDRPFDLDIKPDESEVELAMRRAYRRTIQQLHGMDEHAQYAGATSVTCLIYRCLETRALKLVTANLGDSRAYLLRKGKCILLTRDHKASDPQEQDRVERVGGRITNGRLCFSLQVTKAFGDFCITGLSSDPYITMMDLKPDDTHLVIASDGIWDMITAEECAALLSRSPYKDMSAAQLSQALTNKAIRKGSADNISVVVVKLGMREIMLPDSP